jgi:hypothetical protein
LVLLVGLAFTVNAIEFVCLAALPAIYTHTLALMGLLYVLFFMLDDLVVFGFAAFAIQKIVDTRLCILEPRGRRRGADRPRRMDACPPGRCVVKIEHYQRVVPCRSRHYPSAEPGHPGGRQPLSPIRWRRCCAAPIRSPCTPARLGFTLDEVRALAGLAGTDSRKVRAEVRRLARAHVAEIRAKRRERLLRVVKRDEDDWFAHASSSAFRRSAPSASAS